MRRLIVGWGNPIAGDDRVGWKAAEFVKQWARAADRVDVVSTAHGGLRVAERMLGYDKVIVLDAAAGEDESTGLQRTVLRPRAMTAGDEPVGHDGSLADAIRALQRLDADGMPQEIVLYGAPIAAPCDWDDRPSGKLEEKAARLARAALAELVFEREGIAVA